MEMRAPAFRSITFLFACAIGSAQPAHPPRVTVDAERLSVQPVMKPGQAWTSGGVFNPAAVRVGGDTVLLFRARDHNGTSRIGYASSSGKLQFTARPSPVLAPQADYEKGGGVEDPRVVEIGGLYYLTYTAFNMRDAQLCLATSKDLLHWERRGIILPAYRGSWNTQWTKSGAILPEKINGKWWMYYLGTRTDADGKARDYMGLASSGDLLHWKDATDQPVLPRHPGAFDSRVMEPGPPPILTNAGILLLYNGADDHLVYRPGWVLFDRHDPRRIAARADHPFLAPQLQWEREGNVHNVIFLEGAVREFSPPPSHGVETLNLTGYYGAADTYIGALRIHISITSALKSE
ncbi:MAG: glycoside hydrolase family 130 protein [Bryobacteraceae bacterium]